MNSVPRGLENKLKALLIENAKLDAQTKGLDIRLKQFELEHKPGFWKGVIASPAFLAALIAVFATAGSATVTSIITSHQQALDARRFEETNRMERLKYQTSVFATFVQSIKGDEPCATQNHLIALSNAHIFDDDPINNQVHRLVGYYDDRCRALPSNQRR